MFRSLLLLLLALTLNAVSISSSHQDTLNEDTEIDNYGWCSIHVDTPDATECGDAQGPKSCVREKIGGGPPEAASTYCPRQNSFSSCSQSGCCRWASKQSIVSHLANRGIKINPLFALALNLVSRVLCVHNCTCVSARGVTECTNTNQQMYFKPKPCAISTLSSYSNIHNSMKAECERYSGGRYLANPACTGSVACNDIVHFSSQTGAYRYHSNAPGYDTAPKCDEYVAQGLAMKEFKGCKAMEGATSSALGNCIADAAIGSVPVVGDMYTAGGLLYNDCSLCKGTDACSRAASTAVASKVRDETIKASVGKMAAKAGMSAVKWSAKYAGPVGVGIAFGMGLTDCLMKEILGFSLEDIVSSCLAPSTKLLGTNGKAVSLKHASRGQHFQIYSSGDIQEKDSSFFVEPGQKVNGKMLGWAASYPDHKRVKYKQVSTKGGRQVRVTHQHFLWVNPNKLILAKEVKVGDELPYYDQEGHMQWDAVTDITDVEETGLFSPLILGDDEKDVGDMVLTDQGLVIPIYAGDKHIGLTPVADHKIFKGWARQLEGLEQKYPCLFQETVGGTRIIKLMQYFSELQDNAPAHKKALPDEVSPEAFMAALKKEAPRSVSLQSLLGECPLLAKDLHLEHLEYVHYVEYEHAVQTINMSVAHNRTKAVTTTTDAKPP